MHAPCWPPLCKATTWDWSAKQACPPWRTRAPRSCVPPTIWGSKSSPLTGPVSLLLALAASGLNGQNFAFVGYLPQDASERAQRLRELETLAQKSGQTQLFIETPYRNAAMMQALLQTLQPNTRLAVSSGLTLVNGICRSDSIKNWRQKTSPLNNATPAVFALGR